MLPISSKQTIKLETKDGTKIELAYLLGRMQLDYFNIINEMTKGQKLIKKAETLESLIENDDVIKEEYGELISKVQRILIKYQCDLVDMFIAKIGGKEVKNISSELLSEDVSELAGIIQEHFDEITGKKKEEIKN